MSEEKAFPGLFYCILAPIPGEQSDIFDADQEKFICCTKATPQCMFPSKKAAQQVRDAEIFDNTVIVARFTLHSIDLATGKMDYSIDVD